MSLRLQDRVALASVGVPTLGFAAALIIAMRRGVSGLEIGLFAGMYLLTSLGVEAGMHRFFSHRSFRAGGAVTAALGILGSMAAQGPILFWVAIHRKHHAHTDREGDPHSPHRYGSGFFNRLRGLWHAHVGWLFTLEETQWSRYVPDLLQDRFVFRLNHLYPLWVLAGLLLPALAAGLITRSWAGAGMGLLWGGLVRIFVVDQMTWAVNSFGHLFGRRPHATRCRSGNLAPLAFATLGGSWHNNHHAFPGSARTDQSPWQPDLSGLFIELLAALGLARNVNRTREARLRKGPQTDASA